MDPNHDMLNDIFRITKENNQMLHGMRRRAMVGGLLKFILWAVIIVAPIWFYMMYLNASVQNMLKTMSQLQATGASAQVQLDAFLKNITDLEAKIPGFPHTTSTVNK